MMKKSISFAFVLLSVTALMALTAIGAKAQNSPSERGGWSGRALSSLKTPGGASRLPAMTDRNRGVEAGEDNDPERAAAAAFPNPVDALERLKEARRKALSGTWRIHIPTSATGLPPFEAYHTFGSDGTFTEVSDLFAKLAETPAHGTWDLDGGGYSLTFELFAFDEHGAPVGRIRVRCFIQVLKPDKLIGDAIVDFIEPDGTEILDIDRSPFTGDRLRLGLR